MAIAARNTMAFPDVAPGHLVTLNGITWEYYLYLRDVAPDAWRITYDHGELYVVSPSKCHERNKCRLAGLIERALEELGIDYWEDGSMTLRIPMEMGGEPDASFEIGEPRDVPHLVIESEVSSKLTAAKLKLYWNMGVQELWQVDQNNNLIVSSKGEHSWVETQQSILVPIDLPMIQKWLNPNISARIAKLSLSAEIRQAFTTHR